MTKSLIRIRSEYGCHDSGRHEHPIARPRKPVKGEGEDDEPVYVVEGSQDAMSKEQYDALLKPAATETHKEQSSATEIGDGRSKHDDIVTTGITESVREQLATIGATKKKRQAKVISGEAGKNRNGDRGSPHKEKKQYMSKKSKRVKLSFDPGPDGV
ncbi:MAG: hypothetical protein Q9163_003431 [Psora crenata]